MSRPKVAFFDLSCCEGCQLQIANMGEMLLDVLGLIDLVEFREIMTEKWEGDYDIAFIEGSVTNEEAIERVKEIRRRAKNVVAYGSCATIGGVNGMKNRRPLEESKQEVYGDKGDWYPAIETKPVHAIIDVDYFIHGCPVYPAEVIKVIKSALAGLHYQVPDYSVCVECKFNENVCRFDLGVTCLGPVTRAGCNSWCINNGNVCYGCRGMLSNPNIQGTEEILKTYNIDPELIANKLMMYNAAMESNDE